MREIESQEPQDAPETDASEQNHGDAQGDVVQGDKNVVNEPTEQDGE